MKNLTNVKEDLISWIQLADAVSPVVVSFIIALIIVDSSMPWQLKGLITLASAVATHFIGGYFLERLIKKIQ